MRYFIVAGEASGDLHGSNLIRELIAADRNAEIFCWGGDLMESAGARLLMHYRKTALMGFLLILKNLGTFRRNRSLCKQQINEYKPDVVILIDFPGFNLNIAKYSKKSGFTVFYYISPKFWAWREYRVRMIKKYADRMYIIFPFEVEFYRKHNINVEYYGNPLVDEVERKISAMPSKAELSNLLGLGGKPVIAILAGSRRFEVEYNLPQMIKVVKHFPQHQPVRRSGHAGHPAIPMRENPPDVGGRDLPLPHLDQCADDPPTHLVEETVALDDERQKRAASPNVTTCEPADGGVAFIARVRRERAKVVSAHQPSCRRAHRRQVQFHRHVPRLRAQERIHRAQVPHEIAVLFGGRVKPRMEVGMTARCGQDPDVLGQMGVQRQRQLADRHPDLASRNLDVGHQTERMDAGVGAAGTVNSRSAGKQLRQRLFDFLLHAKTDLLHLPAGVGRAVVGDGELEFECRHDCR